MNWKEALREHWLSQIECLHIIRSDVSYCSCGWKSPICPTVGDAVNAWVEHVSSFVEEEK